MDIVRMVVHLASPAQAQDVVAIKALVVGVEAVVMEEETLLRRTRISPARLLQNGNAIYVTSAFLPILVSSSTLQLSLDLWCFFRMQALAVFPICNVLHRSSAAIGLLRQRLRSSSTRKWCIADVNVGFASVSSSQKLSAVDT